MYICYHVHVDILKEKRSNSKSSLHKCVNKMLKQIAVLVLIQCICKCPYLIQNILSKLYSMMLLCCCCCCAAAVITDDAAVVVVAV